MDNGSFYQLVTARAEQAILQLTGESRGQLDEDNQAHWDMANGVMRLWRDLAGDDIRAEDAHRLELLLADMPGSDDDGERADDPGSGNWHLTAVTYLR